MAHVPVQLYVPTIVPPCRSNDCDIICCHYPPYLTLDSTQPIAESTVIKIIAQVSPKCLVVDLVCLKNDDLESKYEKRRRLLKLTGKIHLCQKTLWTCTPTLTKLVLLNQLFGTDNDVVKIVTKWLPCLQSLILFNAQFSYCQNRVQRIDVVDTCHLQLSQMEITLSDESHSGAGHHISGWRHFLQPFPNLTSLTITSKWEGVGADVLQDVETLRIRYPNGWNLQQFLVLRFQTEMTPTTAQHFQNLQLPLKNVSLEITKNSDASTISSIFSACAPTLQTLRLVIHPEFAEIPKINTFLPFVSKLHLVYNASGSDRFRRCMINLADCFPALNNVRVETKTSDVDVQRLIFKILPKNPNVSAATLAQDILSTMILCFGRRIPRNKMILGNVFFSCIVCSRVPLRQIFQCANGHLVCKECKGLVRQCLKCQTCYEPWDIRALVIEDMLTFANFTCPFDREGCNQVLRRRQYHEHISTCKYRK